MTLPVTPVNVSDGYASLRDAASNVRSYALQVQTGTTGTSAANSSLVLNLLSSSISTLAVADSLVANTTLTAALVSYVQMQTGDPTLAVATDLSDSMTTLGALIQAIVADYPKDAAGHLLDRAFDSSGNVVPISFASAALPKTLPAITAWLATIS